MATASQVTTLNRSFKENDREKFITTAIQLAAHEAQLGHGAVAKEIRQLVDAIKSQPLPAKLLHFKKSDNAVIGELTIVAQPKARLVDLIMSHPLIERIKKILHEYRQRTKLMAHGLSPRRKALLAGPPGKGKTMTARVLAGELHLPLYTVLMDKLVTKYMGETSAKLRQIFSCMPEQRGVYLFDEFDAIGGDRTRDNDVGEMRRVLNSFLQLLEEDDSESLIIAATNEANILDSALFRRFDDVLRFENPDEDSIRELLRNKLGRFWQPLQNEAVLLDSARGLNHAEIAQACSDAIKDAVLNDMSTAPEEYIITSLSTRKAKYSQAGQ